MGPTVIISVGAEFGLFSPDKSFAENMYDKSRNNISRICGYLLKTYPNLKYRASKVVPTISVDVYELDKDSLDNFLLDIRKQDGVDGAEVINNVLA